MSQTKIEKLTSEQEALIPVYREKWRNIALSTEPIDRQKAANAIKAVYQLIGYPEPEIIFCDSPFAACNTIVSKGSKRYLHLYSSIMIEMIRRLEYQILSQQLHKQLSRQLGTVMPHLWSARQVRHLLNSQLETELNSLLPSAIYPQQWAYEGSSFDFFISVLNCGHEPKIWQVFQALVFNCGWLVSFENTCYVCDRPRILCFDRPERLYTGKPAIQFADGWSVYIYDGIWLPEKYGQVHPSQWRSQWLLEEHNAELRRVLIHEIGYARICQELQAVELDSWQEYTLLKIDINFDVEPTHLLKMTCPSTGYIHALRVPSDITSAREAIRWVNWGIDPEEFAVQT